MNRQDEQDEQDDLAAAMQSVYINRMKQSLQSGKVVSAMSIRYSRGMEIVAYAKAAGMDGVFIDLEHSSIDLDQCAQFAMAALAHGITPVVRVPSLECSFVGRVLDSGAQGVIIPHVKDAKEALASARMAKFVPEGTRSAIAGLSALQYGVFSTQAANKAINSQVMVIIMIETLEALDNIEAIAATPNIDVLLIGTNDLTKEFGVPGQHDDPRIAAAYQTVTEASRKYGLALGIGGLYARKDLVDKFVKAAEGIGRFVMCGSDQDYVLEGARRAAGWVEEYNNA